MTRPIRGVKIILKMNDHPKPIDLLFPTIPTSTLKSVPERIPKSISKKGVIYN